MACCKQMKQILVNGEIDQYRKIWAKKGTTVYIDGYEFTEEDYRRYLEGRGLCPFCRGKVVVEKEVVEEKVTEQNSINGVFWACCVPYQIAYECGRIQRLNGDLYFDEIHVLSGCPFCGKKFRG